MSCTVIRLLLYVWRKKKLWHHLSSVSFACSCFDIGSSLCKKIVLQYSVATLVDLRPRGKVNLSRVPHNFCIVIPLHRGSTLERILSYALIHTLRISEERCVEHWCCDKSVMSQLGMLWALGNLAEFRQHILIRAQDLRMEMHVHCFYCWRVSCGICFQHFQFALFGEFFCRRCNLHTLHLLGSLFVCVICALGLHPLESVFVPQQ